MFTCRANVNCTNTNGETPLHVALQCNSQEYVITELLKKGADVTATSHYRDQINRSTLCFALDGGCSKNVVQLLLDAGCPTDLCRRHSGCVLNCATAGISPNKDVIELLIKMKIDLNAIDKDGRSPLCYVLANGSELWLIDMLMEAGGSLNACTQHASPLHCAIVECDVMPILRADVIDKLLKLVRDDDPVQLSDITLLQNVLRHKESENEAIKMLFNNLQGSGTVLDEDGNTLLHLAVSNGFINPSIIEFLIENGVEVNLANMFDETPLHLAAAIYRSPSSIVEILLKAGSSPFAMNSNHKNPLQLTLNFMDSPIANDVDILKMLFIAGSQIGSTAASEFVRRVPYNKNKIITFNYYNMLVKCYLLENPKTSILQLIRYDHRNFFALSAFVYKCKCELKLMKSTIVGGRTLRDLLDDRSLPPIVKINQLVLNQLEVIAGAFPIYFDIIATKIIGGLATEEILKEVYVHTPKYISGQKEIVVLNYHVVCSITNKLTDDDFLRFIIAFRKVDRGMCTARASDEDALKGKRGGEQSQRCMKRPKF